MQDTISPRRTVPPTRAPHGDRRDQPSWSGRAVPGAFPSLSPEGPRLSNLTFLWRHKSKSIISTISSTVQGSMSRRLLEKSTHWNMKDLIEDPLREEFGGCFKVPRRCLPRSQGMLRCVSLRADVVETENNRTKRSTVAKDKRTCSRLWRMCHLQVRGPHDMSDETWDSHEISDSNTPPTPSARLDN